jgi:hypothetical protein
MSPHADSTLQIELHKFVAQIVQKFDLELVDEAHPFSMKTYFFAMQSDMKMRVSRREKHVRFRGQSVEL